MSQQDLNDQLRNACYRGILCLVKAALDVGANSFDESFENLMATKKDPQTFNPIAILLLNKSPEPLSCNDERILTDLIELGIQPKQFLSPNMLEKVKIKFEKGVETIRAQTQFLPNVLLSITSDYYYCYS